METTRLYADRFQQTLHYQEAATSEVIATSIVAVTGVSAGNQHTVRSLLEGPQDILGVNPSGAGHPDDPDAGGILEPADPGGVRTGITTPVAGETYNFRLPSALSLFY